MYFKDDFSVTRYVESIEGVRWSHTFKCYFAVFSPRYLNTIKYQLNLKNISVNSKALMPLLFEQQLPADENIPYAHYLIAICYFEQILDEDFFEQEFKRYISLDNPEVYEMELKVSFQKAQAKKK